MIFKKIQLLLISTLVSLILLNCVSVQKDLSEMSAGYIEHVKSLKSLKIKGHNLKYIDEGEGEVFLLIHGIPTSSWMYRKIIKELSKKYRVIAPDNIGFGQSAKPKKNIHIRQHAEILKVFLEKLNISEFNLMVHDFGGSIALKMLGLGGFNLKKAVILDTFFFEKGWNNGFNFFSMTVNNLLPGMITEAFFDAGIKNMFTSKVSKDVLEGYVRPLKAKNGTLGYSCLYNSIPEVKKDDLPEIQETLKKYFNNENTKVIWGKRDPFLDSKKQVKAITSYLKLKENNVLIIKTGTHLIADENAQEILDFIE